MFTKYSSDSQTWIYQANRLLTINETLEFSINCDDFCKKWTAHSEKLEADFKIIENIFLIFCVNANSQDASGCSIDKLTQFIKKNGEEYNIDWFDRMLLAIEYNQTINLHKISELKELSQKGIINENTYLYDNSISKLGKLNEHWKIKIKNSWLQSKIK